MEQLGVLVLLQRKMNASTDTGGLDRREARKTYGKQNLGLTYRCSEGFLTIKTSESEAALATVPTP